MPRGPDRRFPFVPTTKWDHRGLTILGTPAAKNAASPFLREFFIPPRGGATVDENSVPPWTGGDFRGVLGCDPTTWCGLLIGNPTPALRDRCRFGEGFSSLHPSEGGDFQRGTNGETPAAGGTPAPPGIPSLCSESTPHSQTVFDYVGVCEDAVPRDTQNQSVSQLL
jgi:hypothetical protein